MARVSVVLVSVLVVLIVVAGVAGYMAGIASRPVGTTLTITMPGTAQPPATVTLTVTQAPATQPAGKLKFIVIGKSVHPYWSVVEAGVKKAGQELGVEAIFWVPTREDVQAQLRTMDTYIAEGVAGIAIAPSDPDAASPYIERAIQKGIPVITIDTDAPNSKRLAYLGTGNEKAGYLAGLAMWMLLKSKGYVKPGATLKIAILTGSLTARNSLERIEGFQKAINTSASLDPDVKGDIKIVFLGPYNDREDPVQAFNLALSVIQANPDLVGVFGVYAYDGPAWARALKQAGIPPGKVVLVEFDVTSDNVPPIREGYAQVTVGQRQYFMGYLGVKLLYNMSRMGWEQALRNFIPGYPGNVIYDTGVDLVGSEHMEFVAPTGEKIVILSLDEYKQLAQQLGIPPELLGLT